MIAARRLHAVWTQLPLSSSALLLIVATTLHAQQRPRLTVTGFVGASVFLQDATFAPGNGQQALYVADEADWWHGGDVRNARVTARFDGAPLGGGWSAAATLEIDFFGPFNGTGNFSDEQPLPRLRLAFVDLEKGASRIRVGQDWSLIWGVVPTSVAHLGFPLGWGSGGLIGWRFPGISLRQRLSAEQAPTTVALQLAVLRGSWSDEPAPDGPSAGERGVPQLEARLDFSSAAQSGTPWSAFIAGHYDRKDVSDDVQIDGWALEAGGRVRPGRLTLQGNAYIGQAMGHQFAHIIQFGDIGGKGAWAQLGYELRPNWSLWGFVGTDDPDDSDVAEADATRLRSLFLAPMLRWMNGPYSLGLEWVHNRIDFLDEQDRRDRAGNQLLLSVRYDF